MNHKIHTPTREKKLGHYLGLSYITVGACFLFDPYIGIIDLLPDCIGYLFILLGLYRFADLDDRLGDAMKGARHLALVGIARLVAMFLAFGLVSPTEQPVFMLLALFTLAVLDCIVLIPLWKNICGGLLYMGSRYDATVMFDRRSIGRKKGIHNMVERYAGFSTVYFVLKEALAILPELTVLSHEKGGAELGQETQYYDFVGLFRGIGILLSFIFGIIWLVLTIRFIHRLKGDKPFFEKLTEKYRTEVLTRHELFAMRAVRASLVCLIVAAVLSMDLYLDGVNIIPDVLSAVLMLLSVLFLRRYVKQIIPVLTAIIAYTVSAALTWILQFRYFKYSDTADIFRKEVLYTRWQIMVLLQTITAILFVAAFVLILLNIYKMVKRYTGLHAFRDGSAYAVERTEAIHKLIRKKIIWVGVFAGLAALSTLFHWGVVPMLPEWDLHGQFGDAQTENLIRTMVTTCYQILTEGYWFIDLCIGAALVGVTASATGEIADQMEYSYMMKD